MYLGIDFLIDPDGKPWVAEVNVGLPGGAEEIDRIHRLRFGRPSGIFERIETASLRIYGRSFPAYLESLPFLPALKAFKFWMDGRGPFPAAWHPALRLEDKWVQYQLLRRLVPMPETIPLERGDIDGFIGRRGVAVLKRRSGRGGRGFGIVRDVRAVEAAAASGGPYLLQDFVDSRLENLSLSVRAVVFGGEFLGTYANLAARTFSNHGTIAAVEAGRAIGLGGDLSAVGRFNARSWEARLWFGESDPPAMHRNLYEDTATRAVVVIPAAVLEEIARLAVRIERTYEELDFDTLPSAFFDPPARRA